VYETVDATVELSPRTLNTRGRGRGWVTAHVELPEGMDPALIDVSTIELAVGDESIAAELSPSALGDFDEDGIPDLMVKFSRAAVLDAADGESFEGVVSGSLNNGVTFEGSSSVRVK
jgi:hypothetical protein